MNTPQRNCTSCRNAAIRPEGCSEFTLEGESFHCLKRCNPGIDTFGMSWESYEDHTGSPYNFAQICSEYRSGRPQRYDFGEKLPFTNREDYE